MKHPTVAVLLLLTLAGCASKPPKAGPLVSDYAAVRFATMPKNGSYEATFPESGPRFSFPEGPSTFVGLALPARPQPAYLRFKSVFGGSFMRGANVLVPAFVFLDRNKAPIETAVPPRILKAWALEGGTYYSYQVRIPEQAAFVVAAPARSINEPFVRTLPDGTQQAIPLATVGRTRLELSSVPTAIVADSVVVVSQARAQMFVLKEIGGKSIPDSFGDSRSLSQGRGPNLTTVVTRREVPAGKIRVTLRGAEATGAPILSLIDVIAGDDPEVEAVVDFEPAEGREYIVRGQLQEHGSSIWIEDAATGQPVTEKAVSP
jgi:hypothetical protein